jgi:DsbC/DsbD-like thiol-disulfide interchange protein
MRQTIFARRAARVLLAATLLLVPVNFYAVPAALLNGAQPNIGINVFLSVDRAQRGRTVQAAVVMYIPHGYHVNSNRPGSKFSIPTVLKVDAPRGIRVGLVAYPRAQSRKFSFSEDRIAVYEGQAVLRFNVTVPANYQPGVAQLRLSLKYQSCTDEVCFPPATREINLPVTVVGANESSRNINGQFFGGRRRG